MTGPADIPFLGRISEGGDAAALVLGSTPVSYRELDAALDRAAPMLGGGRRLVAIGAANTWECVVAYLAALRAGHVVLLAPPCRLDDLAGRYRADTVVGGRGIDVCVAIPVHELHPDLAVLLSTSGSTGSPKLVRLSRSNVASNAEAVAASLGLDAGDRAVTTLSPAYSYGLSVLHSHLAVGASVVLTQRSVTDPAFWGEARSRRVTTMAGVPHTFELLDRCRVRLGRDLPSLRLITCAGGRLPVETALRYARMGAEDGFGLAIMYGATEATARMACLPPELSGLHPDTVGWAIPGGSIRIDNPDATGAGRLVYRGPNVMMGYAHTLEDLSRGAELDELVTGDRARVTDLGLLQIVGRDAPFAKVFGLRIDLGGVEAHLADRGVPAFVVERDGLLRIVAQAGDREAVRAVACDITGLPPAAVLAVVAAELPRLQSGKLDRAAASDLLMGSRSQQLIDDGEDLVVALRRAFTDLLGRPATSDDSFVSLRGDSMSYIAVSVSVERLLGHLPIGWHRMTIGELAAAAIPALTGPGGGGRHPDPRTPRGWPVTWAQADVSVVVRAVSILLVVASHAGVVDIRGGAHLLMALVGLSLARYLLPEPDLALRLRVMLRSAARMLLPSLAWIGAAVTLAGSYSWAALGATWLTSPTTDTPDWRYWFIGALVWLLPAVAMLLRVPGVEALRRRARFGLPAAATVIANGSAMWLVPDARPSSLFAPLAVLWMLLLGWTIGEADSTGRRAAASTLVLILVPATFAESRAILIPLGLLALIWVDRVRLPRALGTGAAAVASASLVLYLTHWQVLDVLRGWPALVVSVAAALAGHRALSRQWF